MMMYRLSIVLAILFAAAPPAFPQASCWNCDSERTICIDYHTGYAICEGACNVSGPTCGIAGGCFLAGTMVSTPAGLVPIETLVVGDRVLASYPDGKLEPVTVIDTIKVLSEGFYIINETLRVTGTHPFRVGDQWKDVSDLEIGDLCLLSSGETVLVEAIRQSQMGVRAYNISVEWPNTFFAEDWLVHNKPPIPGG